MLIDCQSCTARGAGCTDCVVTVLLGPIEVGVPDFDHTEQVALGVLADGGLIPPLRLVPVDRRTA